MTTPNTAQAHTAERKLACINIRNADGSGAGCGAKPGSLIELWDENNERIALLHAADLVALAGIPDPADALKLCREALEAYARAEELSFKDKDKPDDWGLAANLRVAALAAITKGDK